ncbi:XRE family transcriptional regulator [Spirosoma aerolatum]|uniref:XRE family transcriptional regulator n=1 Tax=Spirosoma aerolatum TaxID=1211326 RepID=UPI0009ADB12C|nr:XRE family transcriptional regulator [Spirosoma aerolatum]
MDNYLAANLKFLRESKGLSLADMTQRVDIKKNTINNYENGNTEPNLTNLIQLSNFFGCSIDEMIKNDLSKKLGSVAQGSSFQKKHVGKPSIVTVDTTENSIVPILDIKVAAGSPTILDEPDYYKELPVISFPNYFFRGALASIQVRGESMTPTIKQGDYVVGKEIEQLLDLRNGEVYIIVHQQDQRVQFTVKRCFYHHGDDKLLLVSDNSDYPNDSLDIQSILKLYHAEACLTTQLYRQEPSMRGHLERIERRIDRLEKVGFSENTPHT